MTERYILQFPCGINITIFPTGIAGDGIKNIEMSDFKARIRAAFQTYTQGTNPEYIMHDKLAFLNLIRDLNFNVTGKEILNERIRDELDENNDCCIDDINDTESIEGMIDEGIYRYSKEWYIWSGNRHVDEKVCDLVGQAIKIVMDYTPDERGENHGR